MANLVRHDVVVLETSDHNVPVGLIRIEQRYEVYEPSQLQRLFDQYCYWKRDSYQEQTQDDLWVPFMQHLQQLPAPHLQIHIDMGDINQWKEAINKMKSNSARGVCGWSPPELKMLPDRALRHLIDITKGFTAGWPDSMLVSRVVMLAKTTHASSLTEADTRPITIASLVWRLWASVVARQMLRSWIKTFPPGVYGAMPGLSVEDACMPLQKLQLNSRMTQVTQSQAYQWTSANVSTL